VLVGRPSEYDLRSSIASCQWDGVRRLSNPLILRQAGESSGHRQGAVVRLRQGFRLLRRRTVRTVMSAPRLCPRVSRGSKQDNRRVRSCFRTAWYRCPDSQAVIVTRRASLFPGRRPLCPPVEHNPSPDDLHGIGPRQLIQRLEATVAAGVDAWGSTRTRRKTALRGLRVVNAWRGISTPKPCDDAARVARSDHFPPQLAPARGYALCPPS